MDCPLSWIIPATLVTAAFFVFVVGKGIRAQFKPVRAGKETMLGRTVNALSRIDAQGGRVFIEGENLECRERNAGGSRTAGGSHRHRRIDVESETKKHNGEKLWNNSLVCLENYLAHSGPVVVIVVVLAVIVLPQAMRILREYERGVIFRLGKLQGAKGPGLIFLIPVVDKLVRMDLRVVTIDVSKQEVMTRDNVPATVDAVVYFRVVDPNAAVVKVENFWKATSLIAQTTLRSVLGQASLDDLLSQRDVINQKLQEIIDRQTEPWGIKVTAVEIKDVALPDSMKRAMAKQAEAERERRAKIINAEGEFQAAEKMVQAAALIARSRLRCNCAIFRPCAKWPANTTPPRSCPCRLICSARF